MLHNLSDNNSAAANILHQLRDVNLQKNRELFRANLAKMGCLLAYEMSKHLQYKTIEIQTPLAKHKQLVLDEQIVVVGVLRAAMPLLEGVLKMFPDADVSFVGAYRKEGETPNPEIALDYIASNKLDGKCVIIADPMLATANSMIETIKHLSQFGRFKKLFVLSVVSSRFGVDNLFAQVKNVSVFTATMDEILDNKSYIVPGLGDAGDLSFGEKM